MLAHIPLDDQINRLFYLDRGLWRLVYAPALGHCVYRRESQYFDLDGAARLIVEGALLWSPPERFAYLAPSTSVAEVQEEHALLRAFLRSPFGHRLDRDGRARLQDRITDDRAWLLLKAIGQADGDASGSSER